MLRFLSQVCPWNYKHLSAILCYLGVTDAERSSGINQSKPKSLFGWENIPICTICRSFWSISNVLVTHKGFKWYQNYHWTVTVHCESFAVGAIIERLLWLKSSVELLRKWSLFGTIFILKNSSHMLGGESPRPGSATFQEWLQKHSQVQPQQLAYPLWFMQMSLRLFLRFVSICRLLAHHLPWAIVI